MDLEPSRIWAGAGAAAAAILCTTAAGMRTPPAGDPAQAPAAAQETRAVSTESAPSSYQPEYEAYAPPPWHPRGVFFAPPQRQTPHYIPMNVTGAGLAPVPPEQAPAIAVTEDLASNEPNSNAEPMVRYISLRADDPDDGPVTLTELSNEVATINGTFAIDMGDEVDQPLGWASDGNNTITLNIDGKMSKLSILNNDGRQLNLTAGLDSAYAGDVYEVTPTDLSAGISNFATNGGAIVNSGDVNHNTYKDLGDEDTIQVVNTARQIAGYAELDTVQIPQIPPQSDADLEVEAMNRQAAAQVMLMQDQAAAQEEARQAQQMSDSLILAERQRELNENAGLGAVRGDGTVSYRLRSGASVQQW